MSFAVHRVFRILSVALLFSFAMAACGEDDLAIGGSLPQVPTVAAPTPTPTPRCFPRNDACEGNADCCSRVCLFGVCQ